MPHDGPIPYDPTQDDVPPSGRVGKVLATHQQRLMQVDGVTGVGAGTGPAGSEAIFVYALRANVQVPRRIDGLEVFVVVTGPIDAS